MIDSRDRDRIRWRIAITLLAAPVIVLASACSDTDGTPYTADRAQTSKSAGTAQPGSDPAGNGNEPNGSGYPDTVENYAEAVTSAWRDGDLEQLFELTTPHAGEKLIEIPAPPSSPWVFVNCDNTAKCSFYNEAGDYLTVQIAYDKLGSAHAADHVAFTVTAYPDDPVEYVRVFLQARQAGNLARMDQLALPDAVVVYQQLEPAKWTPPEFVDGGAGLAIVKVATAGVEIDTHVGTTLLGQPRAGARWDEAGAMLAQAAKRIEAAGADLLLLCTNTMHKVAARVEAAISIPLLHLADATADSSPAVPRAWCWAAPRS